MTRAISLLIALAFLALALVAAVGIATHWGEPALRSVARAVFALVLAELAHLAWRWPRSLPRRFRDRAARLLAVMASPERHLDYAESTPQVSLPVAFLDDWERLVLDRRELGPGALSPEESEALDHLGRVIDHLRPSLLPLGMIPITELPEHEAWRLLVEAARRARDAWASGPGRDPDGVG